MKTSVTTKIKDIKFGAKEDQITLTIDGNITDVQVSILRSIKKTGVAFVSFSSSQLDIDDVEKEDVREGIRGSINNDGTVNVDRDGEDPNQLTIDEAEVEEGDEEDTGPTEEEQEGDGEPEDGTDGEEDPEQKEESECPPIDVSDDDLPF